MAQIAKLTGISVPIGADNAVAHGLVRTPSIVALLHGTEADISKGADPDDTYIYLTNGGGVPENAEVLVIAPHSIADSEKQMALLEGDVEVGDEVAVPHGLVRTPTFVLLCFGSGANVSLGATAANATNIFLDNGGVGDEAYSVLVMAPHSIIA